MWWKQNALICKAYADPKCPIIKLCGKKTTKGNTSETPSKRNSRGQKTCWDYTGACSRNEDDKILRFRRRSCLFLDFLYKMARNWGKLARKHQWFQLHVSQIRCGVYQKHKYFTRVSWIQDLLWDTLSRIGFPLAPRRNHISLLQ